MSVRRQDAHAHTDTPSADLYLSKRPQQNLTFMFGATLTTRKLATPHM